jgi:transcription elongation factor GreA
VYSPESAVGHAILGARAGDRVGYTAPSGAEIAVTVVSFQPYGG